MKLKKEDNSKITYINQGNEPPKAINKKRLIIAITIFAIILSGIILFVVYAKNSQFRNFCDIKILRKNVSDMNLPTINLDNTSKSTIFAYYGDIAVIKDNKMTKYNSNAKEESEFNIEVTTPLISTNGEYAAISEKSGKRLYLIGKDGIIWQKDLEGNISRASVNNNGYVSVILSGTSYKSVIVLFDNEGNELFRTYLSTTIAVDSAVSEDDKYLSFAEVNISGTLIQSNIKIIEIEKAKQNPSDSIVYTYKADGNSLIINIKAQKNKLICMYDNSIHQIENKSDKKIVDLTNSNEKITYSDINLNGNITYIAESTSSLFANNIQVKLINTNSGNKNEYDFSGTIKKVYCNEDRIAVNTGNEIHFIDMNGWLAKKFISSNEIRDVVISEHLAGIVYKDKVEFLNI